MDISKLLSEHNEAARKSVEKYVHWNELNNYLMKIDFCRIEYKQTESQLIEIGVDILDYGLERLKPLSLELCEALIEAQELKINFMVEEKEITYHLHLKYSNQIGMVGLFPQWNIFDNQSSDLIFNGTYFGSLKENTAITSIDPVNGKGKTLFDAIYNNLGNHKYMGKYFSELPLMMCHSVEIIR